MARIYLSPPHLDGDERALLLDAFDSNWIAPLGPHVDAFEEDICAYAGSGHALALSSGTAALHLALILSGVEPGDKVFCSTLTFVATVNAIRYCSAEPVFIDSETKSWNLDPQLLAEELERCAKIEDLPRALIVVHVFGQSADLDPIVELCKKYGVKLIEDAAESLGATYKGKHTGTLGDFGVYSFNGNKIMTTSGGGMLISNNSEAIEKARFLSTQAREPYPYYQHECVGYNYRMSNLLAAVGRGQLAKMPDKVARRRDVFGRYYKELSVRDGIGFMPEADFGLSNRWLSVITIDEGVFGESHETVRLRLESLDIEARPVWKPMHMQPVFSECRVVGGNVAESIFAVGLCLPSGTQLTDEQQMLVVSGVLGGRK